MYNSGKVYSGSGRNGYGSVPSAQKKEKIVLSEDDYVNTAEKVMDELHNKMKSRLTTSKIRNLLSMVSDLYNDVKREHNDTLSPEWVGRIQYLRVRFAYEAGRDSDVKDFVDKADLLNIIEDIGNSRKKLILFCHYMEALVAYHRYYHGKDF